MTIAGQGSVGTSGLGPKRCRRHNRCSFGIIDPYGFRPDFRFWGDPMPVCSHDGSGGAIYTRPVRYSKQAAALVTPGSRNRASSSCLRAPSRLPFTPRCSTRLTQPTGVCSTSFGSDARGSWGSSKRSRRASAGCGRRFHAVVGQDVRAAPFEASSSATVGHPLLQLSYGTGGFDGAPHGPPLEWSLLRCLLGVTS